MSLTDVQMCENLLDGPKHEAGSNHHCVRCFETLQARLAAGLTDVQMREAAQNFLIVRRVESMWVPVDADACLFNPLNGEVVPIDDVDVPEGFVVALAVRPK